MAWKEERQRAGRFLLFLLPGAGHSFLTLLPNDWAASVNNHNCSLSPTPCVADTLLSPLLTLHDGVYVIPEVTQLVSTQDRTHSRYDLAQTHFIKGS